MPMRERSPDTESAAQPLRDRKVGSPFRPLGVALLCAKLALIPVVFDYNANVPFTVVKGRLRSHDFRTCWPRC
jgi:hypothetical protein